MAKVDNKQRSTIRSRRKLPIAKGLAVLKQTVLVIVDGKTEEMYFDKLNKLGLFPNIRFKTVMGDDSNFEIIFRENLELKEKFIILDIDHCNHHIPKRMERIRWLRSKKFLREIIFYNNYSFETFLLNHKIKFAAPITDSIQYDIHMNTQFSVQNWHNNKTEHALKQVMNDITDDSHQLMLINILEIHKEDCFENPSSNMSRFFERIKTIK